MQDVISMEIKHLLLPRDKYLAELQIKCEKNISPLEYVNK